MKKKDSLVWLEELVEAAKAWRVALVQTGRDLEVLHPRLRAIADAVDGFRQAIKDEVEEEMEAEERNNI
jgi:uncharacterized protein YycO